jgi:ATP-binding cassette subfamily B protein
MYSILFLSCYLFIFYKSIQKGIKLSIIKEKNIIFLSEKLSDQFSNLLNIYINNQENTIIKETNKNLESFQENIKNEVNTYGNIFLINNFMLILYLIISFFIIYYLHKKKKLITNNFITILIIIGFFVNNGYLINQDCYPVLLKITPLFANYDFLKFIFSENKSGSLKDNITGNIEFKNIYFRYNKNQKFIINNFNLKIKSNSKIAIVGRSGSGKTTVCKLLLNLYNIEKGDILIDNKSIKKFDTTFLRNNIIYVNQKTTLFNTSVINNLKFGNDKDEKYIVNLLNKYNINIFDKLNNSVGSDSGVNGSNLSLGMQKIIFIMRGLLKESNIIIFDEPLSGLDEITKKNVIHLIKNYCKHKTVIIVTHDKEIIPYVDKVIQF